MAGKSTKFEFTRYTVDSWADLGLIEQKVEISTPKVRTSYITIPGRSGTIDLTEAITGVPTLEDREITWTYAMKPDEDWTNIKSAAMAELHGQTCKIWLHEDELNWYYKGRTFVDSTTSDGVIKNIVVKATVEPWKYYKNLTTETKTITTSTPTPHFDITSDAPLTLTLTADKAIEWSKDNTTWTALAAGASADIFYNCYGGNTSVPLYLRRVSDDATATVTYQTRYF